MAKSKGTTGNSNTPVSKFEELLETSIKINNNENDKYKDYFDYVEALYILIMSKLYIMNGKNSMISIKNF